MFLPGKYDAAIPPWRCPSRSVHMDMSASLQANNEQLYALWSENSGLVVSLQMTLLDQILPNVVDELEIDPEDVKGAREWLQDVGK